MEVDSDKSIIINLEHAYAASESDLWDDNKTDEHEEVAIKTEEVFIKTEAPDSFEIVPQEILFETLDIKEENIEPMSIDPYPPLHDNKQESDPLDINSSLSINQHMYSDKFIPVGKEALKQMQNNLTNKNHSIKELKQSNKVLYLENQDLMLQLKELQKSSRQKVNILLKQNDTLVVKLKEYETISKNYKILEDQMVLVSSKMGQFMNSTLPKRKFSEENIVTQLKSQIEIKEKQYQHLDIKVNSLIGLINTLKEEITTLTEKNKYNLLNATKRAEELELKLKNSIEIHENREKTLTQTVDNMVNHRLKLEEKVTIKNVDIKELSNRYRHSLLQISNLKTKLKATDTKLMDTITKLTVELELTKKELKAAKSKSCDYCGL